MVFVNYIHAIKMYACIAHIILILFNLFGHVTLNLKNHECYTMNGMHYYKSCHSKYYFPKMVLKRLCTFNILCRINKEDNINHNNNNITS